MSGINEVTQFGALLWQALRSPTWRRLAREREAGEAGAEVSPPSVFDATLSRLTQGRLENNLWRKIASRIGFQLTTPPVFLRQESTQLWLQAPQTQEGLKFLARSRLFHGEEAPEVREELCRTFFRFTGTAETLAGGYVDAVTGILAAGFLASVPKAQDALLEVGLENLQVGRQERAELKKSIEDLQEGSTALELSRYHTRDAQRELRLIQKKRAVDPLKARHEFRSLVQRVQEGNLKQAEETEKADALYWAARLHASCPDTLDDAKDFRKQLPEEYSSYPIEIIDALVLEAEGDSDAAIRLLRDSADPDSRATLFTILARNKGDSKALAWFRDQADSGVSEFFTGLGWCSLSVTLARTGNWREAAETLLRVRELWAEWPDLAFLEGVINAALLLPEEHRSHALNFNILHRGINTMEGSEAEARRQRASHCLDEASRLWRPIYKKPAEAAQQWLLWLRLTDSDNGVSRQARAEVEEGMKEPGQALDLIQVALAFDIPFDRQGLWRYLEKRSDFGGLTDWEQISQLLLAGEILSPRDFFSYLEDQKNRLRDLLSLELFTAMRIEALMADGQSSRAKQELEGVRERLGELDHRRLDAMIQGGEGQDIRAQLEKNFRASNEIQDLEALIHNLRDAEDWETLLPLLRDLFGREHTSRNALLYVECLRKTSGSHPREILEFLNANEDLVANHSDLVAFRVVTLLEAGQIQDARATLEELREMSPPHPSLLDLDIDLALQAGDWERFSEIVGREWEQHEQHEPATLLRLARMAAESEQSRHRAVELMKQAAEKGEDDPHILMGAINLAYRLGEEGRETTGKWLPRALELSSDQGPVTRVSIKDLVETWMPQQRQRSQWIQDQLLKGQIPIHLAAHSEGASLSSIFLRSAEVNSREQDGRKRGVIPSVAGSRQPVQIDKNWAVGLDLTSIFTLHFLGLLEKSLESLGAVVIAPATMASLLDERNQARFHQPSKVKAAKEVATMVRSQELSVEEALPGSPAWLVAEVGEELAQLLEAAKQTEGRVVHPRPLHRRQSWMSEEADLKEYKSYLISPGELSEILYRRGMIDTGAQEQISTHLAALEPHQLAVDEGISLEPARPIYLSDLALTYCQEAGLLSALGSALIDCRLHPSTLQGREGLIRYDWAGESLAAELERIRQILRHGLRAGNVKFLPRRNRDSEKLDVFRSAPTLVQLVAGLGECDVVSFDDRLMNSKALAQDSQGRSVPVVCVLDIVRYLQDESRITREERFNALHKLRKAGFALIEVGLDELRHICSSARWEDGVLQESPEMRILRQTLARLRGLQLIRVPEELTFLGALQRNSIAMIFELWADSELTVSQAAQLSDWLWRRIAVPPLNWIDTDSTPPEGGEFASPTTALARHLSLLVRSLIIEDEGRRQHFLTWVESQVLMPLVPANSSVVDVLAEITGNEIARWSQVIADRIDEEELDS